MQFYSVEKFFFFFQVEFDSINIWKILSWRKDFFFNKNHFFAKKVVKR